MTQRKADNFCRINRGAAANGENTVAALALIDSPALGNHLVGGVWQDAIEHHHFQPGLDQPAGGLRYHPQFHQRPVGDNQNPFGASPCHLQAQLPTAALPGEQHVGSTRREFEHESGERDPGVMFEFA